MTYINSLFNLTMPISLCAADIIFKMISPLIFILGHLNVDPQLGYLEKWAATVRVAEI